MMELNGTYNRDYFLHFLETAFLTDFKKDIRPVSAQGTSSIQKAFSLGRSESLDLQVFEFSFEGSPNKRVTLTKDAFQIMRSFAIFQALAIFRSSGSDDWRLSLMTATPERTEKGKVALVYSNPKRLSFFLGPNAKVNTPTKFLLKRGMISDFDDLRSRFSIEVVNKEFYKEISALFTQLVGGSIQNGKKVENYKSLLKLPDVPDHSQTSLEFAVRLIGRVIFCWFLREKKSNQSKSLMPHDLLSLEAVNYNPDYYHKVLEPIFFEVLNKPGKSRKEDFDKEPFSSVPYLNGGLFSPHDDDFFRYNGDNQNSNGRAVVPDEWLLKFFDILETYNFTIDENTSFDEELSIDPEMLGRIFENLLAEINPETGESARKNTGSYYTPRTIVDYMVDESLRLYLKNQTKIDEEKLRAAISYDLNDDEEKQLTEDERERIISALERIKILDPACGSGAFPIGALQKIVFILQQADPEGHLWFKKQIRNTSPELRRVVEREFAHKNFDYIRKLGIIRENIYGVDIQPIATEISRLRCFLTLVVDERIQDDLENRGIEPLPNLDFKFVTANSLIGLPGSQENSQIGLFEDDAGIRELKELRDMFFNASGAERDQLKLQFVQAQNRMLQRLNSVVRGGHAALTTKLSTWDPFSHKSSSWFDPEWMFGIKEGFDILIANPPYIRVHKQEQAEKEILKQNYTSPYKDFDIYIVFIELGIKLLKKSGVLCYITSDKYLVREYGSKLREIIFGYQIVELYDISRARDLFGAAVYPLITIIRKNQPNDKTKVKITNSIKLIDKPSTNYYFDQSQWKQKGLIELIQEDDLKILSRIYSKSKPLADLIKNDIFCGTPRAKDYYAWADGITNISSDQTIKLLVCSNLEPYRIDHSIKVRTLGRVVTSPFFDNSQKIITKSKWDDFLIVPKILIRGNDTRITAVLDTKPSVFVGIYGIKFIDETKKKVAKYLLALLNSSLYQWVFEMQNPSIKIGGEYFSINSNHITRLPYIEPPEDIVIKINQLVDKIHFNTGHDDYRRNSQEQSQVKESERQIDLIVYKLFGLTEEEIETIEGRPVL